MALSASNDFLLPPATGLTAQYYGNYSTGNTTTHYYWVQVIYPDGRSSWTGVSIANQPAEYDSNDVLQLNWNPMPGAIGYDVVRTTALTIPSAPPSGTQTSAKAVGLTYNAYRDKGEALFSYTVTPPLNMMQTAYAKYSFAVDGGAEAAIIPSVSDIIPANALVIGCFVVTDTTVTSSGSATIEVGTSAGSSASSLLAATGKSSFAAGDVIYGIPTLPTYSSGIVQPVAFVMSAAGQIQLTVGTAALTAGIVEVYVQYY